MADKLKDMFDDWAADTPDMSGFTCYQAGFTKSAQLMRQRAMALAQKLAQKPSATQKDLNSLVNAIGQLSDVPE